MIKFKLNELWGLKNEDNVIIQEPKFIEIHDFVEERAIVYMYYENKDDNRYGFIDITGKLVIAPEYIKVENFKDGVAIVFNEYFGALIDLNGQKLTHKPLDNIIRQADGTFHADWLWTYRDHHEVTLTYVFDKSGKLISSNR